MEEMLFQTGIRKARDGEFEFTQDARLGYNIVRFTTPGGKRKEKEIYLK